MKCRHEHFCVDYWKPSLVSVAHPSPWRRHTAGGQLFQWQLLPILSSAGRAVCASCGETLSLGPANDYDERVRVEIRAAELSAAFTKHGSTYHAWLAGAMSDSESDGVNAHISMSGEVHGNTEAAGYLASVIAAHEEEAE